MSVSEPTMYRYLDTLTLVGALIAALLQSVCMGALAADVGTGLPKGVPGLWRIELTTKDEPISDRKYEVCGGEAWDALSLQMWSTATKVPCSDVKTRLSGDKVQQEFQCEQMGVHHSGHSEGALRDGRLIALDRHLRSEYPARASNQRPWIAEMTMVAKWRGACPTGVEVGDVRAEGHREVFDARTGSIKGQTDEERFEALVQSAPAEDPSGRWIRMGYLPTRQDDATVLEMDRDSVVREGNWATVWQRLWLLRSGPSMKHHERFAMNCLTGATGVVEADYEANVVSGLPHASRASFDEIERMGQRTDFASTSGLGDVRMRELLCGCASPRQDVQEPGDEELQRLFDLRVREQIRVKEVHLSMMSLKSQEMAEDVSKRLESGASFASLADAFSSDRRYIGGDTGWRTEQAWRLAVMRLVDELPIGGRSKPTKMGDAWFIFQMEGRRSRQPDSFAAWKGRLRAASMFAAACNRVLE